MAHSLLSKTLYYDVTPFMYYVMVSVLFTQKVVNPTAVCRLRETPQAAT
jgi:hypothetical protein